MTDLARPLAVAVTEIGMVQRHLPALLGREHPQAPVVAGALTDVAAGLFAATQQALAGDEAGAGDGRATQLRALRCLQRLLAEVSPAPVRAQDLDDALEVIAGLLELAGEAEPPALA